MTREDFIANGMALHGSAVGWQTGIARRLGVDSRTIRRAVANGPSDKLAAALLALMGETAPQLMHAEWICGDGDDGREYLIHTRHPRFRCIVLADDLDEPLEKDDGVQFQAGDTTLCGFHWIDPKPHDLVRWMERAADALDGFAA